MVIRRQTAQSLGSLVLSRSYSQRSGESQHFFQNPTKMCFFNPTFASDALFCMTNEHAQDFLKHCRFFSLCFDGSSAVHQCGMAPSCETLQFGRLAPQRQGGRNWIDKDLSTSGTASSSQIGGKAFLLANAVAVTRPRHKPQTIPGRLARTFAKYPFPMYL